MHREITANFDKSMAGFVKDKNYSFVRMRYDYELVYGIFCDLKVQLSNLIVMPSVHQHPRMRRGLRRRIGLAVQFCCRVIRTGIGCPDSSAGSSQQPPILLMGDPIGDQGYAIVVTSGGPICQNT
ncbi:unnamed protein product [Haemonchus placei]|uniref:Uncharacterized protein n=1 Tax=Haemonchus placei TaxID=6290 RepID=A0A0N4X717_HAEPC|nr:unnamed protein product [Haemonchus placei]